MITYRMTTIYKVTVDMDAWDEGDLELYFDDDFHAHEFTEEAEEKGLSCIMEEVELTHYNEALETLAEYEPANSDSDLWDNAVEDEIDEFIAAADNEPLETLAEPVDSDSD